MKLIPLGSKKYPGNHAIVDDEDFDKVKKYKYNCVVIANSFYARRYIRDKETGKMTWIFIAEDIIGKPRKGLEINFVNKNPLDNRKENLRKRTHQANIVNSKIRNKKTQSGFKGVSVLRVHDASYFRTTIPRTVLFKNKFIAKVFYDVISVVVHKTLACNNNTEICKEARNKIIEKFEELNANRRIPHKWFESQIEKIMKEYDIIA